MTSFLPTRVTWSLYIYINWAYLVNVISIYIAQGRGKTERMPKSGLFGIHQVKCTPSTANGFFFSCIYIYMRTQNEREMHNVDAYANNICLHSLMRRILANKQTLSVWSRYFKEKYVRNHTDVDVRSFWQPKNNHWNSCSIACVVNIEQATFWHSFAFESVPHALFTFAYRCGCTFWSINSIRIAFGCSPNIRCTNECCLLRLGYTSISTFLSIRHA